MPKTVEFEHARCCYRPEAVAQAANAEDDVFSDSTFQIEFNSFTEAVCGKHVDDDAYGKAGNAIKLKQEALFSFANTLRTSDQLIAEMTRHQLFEFDPPGCMQDVRTIVTDWLNSRPADHKDAFMQRAELRLLQLKDAFSRLGLLESRVRALVQARRGFDVHYLEWAQDDVMENIFKHLTSASALTLMQTCKQFQQDARLKDRLPHLRIRSIVGVFPHYRTISRDRSDIAAGKSKPVVRNFVVARQAVRLYLDFVIQTMRSVPLKKLPRKDGLDNTLFDHDDDEFETPPEAQANRGPQVTTHDGTEWNRKQALAGQRRRKEWMNMDGPEEVHDRYLYMRRVDQSRYFDGPLQCTVKLVYADNKKPVPCTRFSDGLQLSNALSEANGVFSSPTDNSNSFHPAMAKFHVPHLTTEHDNQLFRICITGTQQTRHGKTDFKQVVYSEPFEVVSKFDVVQKAFKRRTTNQIKQDGDKRAKGGASKA